MMPHNLSSTNIGDTQSQGFLWDLVSSSLIKAIPTTIKPHANY